jgi:hypothetical protein
MWTKIFKTNIFEYQNGILNIYDNSGESKQLYKSIRMDIKSEKEFEMEIIYYSEKIANEELFINSY